MNSPICDTATGRRR